MAAPVMSALSTPGNLLASQSLGNSGGNVGVYKDASAIIKSIITGILKTGGSVAATAGVRFEAWDVYGSTTLNGGVSGAGTSLVVTSATGFYVGQKIGIGSDGTNAGEIVTISAIAGSTLTISALQRAHLTACPIYLISSPATIQLGATAANTTYTGDFALDTNRYYLAMTNLDGTNSVTVEMSANDVTAFS